MVPLASRAPDAPVSVIDDDPDVREALRFDLELEGFRVDLYEKAEAMLEREVGAAAGCVVVDQYMPGMTGLELTSALRARGFAAPIVLITGRPGGRLCRRAAVAGVDAVLEKPLNGTALAKTIRRMLEDHV